MQRTGKTSKLHSVFVSGYVLTLTDEGAYRNELENGDMRRAPEALRLVRSGGAAATVGLQEVALGKYYGNVFDRSLRVVHNERILHPLQPYIVEATANQIEYFEKVFSLDSGLSSRDQIWYWKEILSLIALVAAVILLIPMAQLMLRTFWLALTLFVAYYLLLFTVYYFFHVDYRFLFMGVRGFRAVGLLLIVIVQYVTFAATGIVYWTDGWLYINLLFAVVPMMFVLPYFNRYFFRMTGRIYLGPMATCLVFVMILLTNTVCYLPL